MNILPFKFETTNIRVFRDELEHIWFVAKDIALSLEYPKSSIDTIGKLLLKVPEEWKGRKRFPTLGGNQNLAVLSEQGLYFFIGRSDKSKALPFQKWIAGEVLPSIRKTGSYSISENSNETKTDRELKGLKMATEILRVNEGSKILMMKKLYQKIGLETEYLPNYSEENHTFSLTHLLKEFEVNLSAKRANEILLAKGILEIQTRKSSKSSELKEFKSLTENGLKFGKNLISPNNQLETQPHYFRETFTELLEFLKS
jgi:prophage antirepressor-like protein